MIRGAFLILFFLNGFAIQATSQPSDTAAAKSGVTISGLGSMEFGQLVAYQYRGDDFQRAWLSQAKVQLSAQKMVNSWMSIFLGIEGSAWYETYDKFSNNPFVVPEQFFTFIIHESKVAFSWGDLLALEAGVFPYKYNPEVRNLGEYIFRSGAYPGFLIGDFDFPLARLTGLRAHNRLYSKLDQDLLLTFEEKYKPFHDVTLTWLAAYAPHPVATVGGAVSFSHLISVDEKETTPGTSGAWYYENFDTLNGDTVDLTFRGIKFMGRICLDVKTLFNSPLFGPEDLKLYSEAAILGAKDYQLYYDTLLQRIPVMVGFNVPTFKVLDVLACEAEWYGSPYPNNYTNASSVQPQPRPIPDPPHGSYTNSIYKEDNWKWSVYLKKTIARSFCVTTQFARDHFRTKADNSWNVEREESLTKDGHWYWIAKLSYMF